MFWATILAQISSNVSTVRPEDCRKSLRHTLAPFSDAKFTRPTARPQHVGLREAAILCHLAPAAAGHWQSAAKAPQPLPSSSSPAPALSNAQLEYYFPLHLPVDFSTDFTTLHVNRVNHLHFTWGYQPINSKTTFPDIFDYSNLENVQEFQKNVQESHFLHNISTLVYCIHYI